MLPRFNSVSILNRSLHERIDALFSFSPFGRAAKVHSQRRLLQTTEDVLRSSET